MTFNYSCNFNCNKRYIMFHESASSGVVVFSFLCGLWHCAGIFKFRLPDCMNKLIKLLSLLFGFSLSERRAQFIASQMYKITHDLAPKRLSNIFHETPFSRHYNLRGPSIKLCLPQPKTDYLKKSLSYREAKLWNSLSDDIRNKKSLSAFKTSIRAPGQVLKTS